MLKQHSDSRSSHNPKNWSCMKNIKILFARSTFSSGFSVDGFIMRAHFVDLVTIDLSKVQHLDKILSPTALLLELTV